MLGICLHQSKKNFSLKLQHCLAKDHQRSKKTGHKMLLTGMPSLRIIMAFFSDKTFRNVFPF